MFVSSSNALVPKKMKHFRIRSTFMVYSLRTFESFIHKILEVMKAYGAYRSPNDSFVSCTDFNGSICLLSIKRTNVSESVDEDELFLSLSLSPSICLFLCRTWRCGLFNCRVVRVFAVNLIKCYLSACAASENEESKRRAKIPIANATRTFLFMCIFFCCFIFIAIRIVFARVRI